MNTPKMRGYEMQVLKALESGQTVDYVVQLIYRGSDKVPHQVRLSGRGDGGLSFDVTLDNF